MPPSDPPWFPDAPVNYAIAVSTLRLLGENISSSLGAQPDSAVSSRPAGITMLEQLNLLSAKELYTTIADDQIRLVTIYADSDEASISCSLSVESDDELPEYEALSYVWGCQDTCQTIKLNGTACHVTKNLYCALLRLRYPDKNRVIWIDALSINQSDISERNKQVRKMSSIYSRAACTLICLEAESIYTPINDERTNLMFEYARECIPKLQSRSDDNKWICEKFSLLSLDVRVKIGLGLCSVILLPYWSRAWVFQEIMHSRKAQLLYGSCCISYSGFIQCLPVMVDVVYDNLQAHWEHLARTVDDLSLSMLKGLPAVKREANGCILPCGRIHHGEYLTLNDWIAFAHQRIATDPRDKIFAFYNCFAPEIRSSITVNYRKHVRDVLIQITPSLFTGAKTLDIMFKRRSNHGPSYDMPSWVWIPEGFGVQSKSRNSHQKIEIPLVEKCRWAASASLPLLFDVFDQGKALKVHGKAVFVISFVASPVNLKPIGGEVKIDELNADTGKRHLIRFMNHFKKMWELLQPRSTAQRIAFVKAFNLGTPNDRGVTVLLLWLTGIISFAQIPHPPAMKLVLEHCGRSLFSCIPVNNERAADGGNEENTTYGLGPSDIVPGDKVCVLQGCTVPVILRKTEEYYVLVGESKVPEIMLGEAVKGIQQGDKMPEEFVIR